MRILVVDDDVIALAMLEKALVEAGHEVRTALHGQEALDVLQAGRHRLVISDWEMPGISGLELCSRIRSGEVSHYVYTILLTGRDSTKDIVAGLSAGADDFITKPFHPAELLVRVRTGERILSLETRDLTIFALAKLAESRDPETGTHLERVRNYAFILATDLVSRQPHSEGVDPQFARLIYLTSPLHDIGKVAIPDCVLLKPGRLSDREFEIMKTHTTLGARTLEAALQEHPGASFLRMACEIASTHHERFDGSGYPAGLRGEEIPLSGRIVAVADVYDALTTKRVYKGAFGHDVAKAMIVQGSGTHFDPAVVEAYMRNEAQFDQVRQQLADLAAEAEAA